MFTSYNVRFFIYITDVSLMREAVEAIILIIKNIFFKQVKGQEAQLYSQIIEAGKP